MTKTMKVHLLLISLLSFILSSCQSITPLSIDYLQPADISFPSQLRRIGVVNNVPVAQTDTLQREEKETEESITLTEQLHGNARIATESLAHGIAEANYFDAVVICDSALQSPAQPRCQPTLTEEEVTNLAAELDVDIVISLEALPIQVTHRLTFLPQLQAYLATTDARVRPTFQLYIPGRKGPLAAIQPTDSIYWEEIGMTLEQAQKRLIKPEQLVTEASEFAGTTPIEKLLPHWKSAPRYLFTGGSVAMRDAAIYVRENNWSEAINLWEQAYQQCKGKKKARAAHNLAVGCEMQDRLPEALEWARKAQQEAYHAEKVEEKKSPHGIEAEAAPLYALSSIYVGELQQRTGQLSILTMQMERFQE